jgi:acetoin utilization protein AcuB
MKVSAIMSQNLLTVSPGDSVEKAAQLFRQRRVRHLLVLQNQRLVGMLSDHDLMRAMEPLRTKKRLVNLGGLFFLLEPLEVREIMTRNVVSVSPEYSLEDAAALMVRSRFGALPVVSSKREVLGIVTQTDLLRCLAKAPQRGALPPRLCGNGPCSGAMR